MTTEVVMKHWSDGHEARLAFLNPKTVETARAHMSQEAIGMTGEPSCYNYITDRPCDACDHVLMIVDTDLEVL